MVARALIRAIWLHRIRQWKFGPAATEVILSTAMREDGNPTEMAEALENAIVRAEISSEECGLSGIDWILPEKPQSSRWTIKERTVVLEVSWNSGVQINDEGIWLPTGKIPESILATLPGKRLHEVIDLPVLRENYPITSDQIERISGKVRLNVLRESRTFEDMMITLKKIKPNA